MYYSFTLSWPNSELVDLPKVVSHGYICQTFFFFFFSEEHSFIILHWLQRDSVLSLNCSVGRQTCFYITGLMIELQVQTQFVGPNKLQVCKGALAMRTSLLVMFRTQQLNDRMVLLTLLVLKPPNSELLISPPKIRLYKAYTICEKYFYWVSLYELVLFHFLI